MDTNRVQLRLAEYSKRVLFSLLFLYEHLLIPISVKKIICTNVTLEIYRD